MRRLVSTALCSILSSGALGCSAIVGIEDRSGTWCTLEAADTEFCEDFDQEPPFQAWMPLGSPATAASDRSEPNAMRATAGTALKRDLSDMEEPVTFSLDVRVERDPDPASPQSDTSVYDTALVLVTRPGGTLGLYADRYGSLYFASAAALPSATPDVQGTAEPRWRQVRITYDAGSKGRAARFSIDGTASRMVAAEDPGHEPEESVATVLTIGALSVLSTEASVGCAFDNVTVDDASASGELDP